MTPRVIKDQACWLHDRDAVQCPGPRLHTGVDLNDRRQRAELRRRLLADIVAENARVLQLLAEA